MIIFPTSVVCKCLDFFFFEGYGDHRDLHKTVHSFPTRRSSDLLTGLDEARRHWGQTLLSLLGLILGTASIVTVLALFGGQTALTEQFLSEVGGRGTIIVSDREPSAHPRARELASKRLTFRDAQYLRDRANALAAVSPGWAQQRSYRVGNTSFTGQVIGTVPAYMVINDIKPLVGRYLSDLDVQRQARVAVLGR